MSVAGASIASPSSSARESDAPVANKWQWAAAAATVAVLAYGPLMWMFFRQQWEKPHYQYFPFVIAAFGWLLWQRYQQGEPRRVERTRRAWVDSMLLAVSFALLAAAILLLSPWAAAASLILLAGYACRLVGRQRRITNLFGIWVMLWLLVPLPFGLDQKLTTRLQFVSSKLSSFVLDGLGVHHLMDGNTLTLPGKRLFVDEACSGIVSILSVVACAVIYGVVKNRTPLHLVLLALAGIGWATVINVARISSIAFILSRWGVDWSEGAAHEILSLSLFMVTFIALLSTDRILEVCLEPVLDRWHEVHANELRVGDRVTAAWDWLTQLGRPREFSADPAAMEAAASARIVRPAFSWRPVLLFVPLALGQTALFAYAVTKSPANIPAVQRAVALKADALPKTLLGLEQIDFKGVMRDPSSIHGMYSRTYTYQSPQGANFVVSFDFPFIGGWHELTMCYTAGGWQPLDRRVDDAADPVSQRPWRCVEADFDRPGGDRGAVLFSEFDQYGQPYDPQEGWLRPDDAFWKVRNLYLEDRRAFQVQVWMTDATAASEADRQKARELLLTARDRFRDLIINGSPSKSTSK